MLRKKIIRLFFKNVFAVVAVVLVWRGIWITMDIFDQIVFGGSHYITAIFGIVIGLIMLYILDDDLKEFERL